MGIFVGLCPGGDDFRGDPLYRRKGLRCGGREGSDKCGNQSGWEAGARHGWCDTARYGGFQAGLENDLVYGRPDGGDGGASGTSKAGGDSDILLIIDADGSETQGNGLVPANAE